MTAKNSSTDISHLLKKDEVPRTEVDCHIFLEDGAHNVLYDGFCLEVPRGVDGRESSYLKAAYGDAHWMYAAYQGTPEDRFVWCFEPKW
ncbi:hypothetical protein [Bordetella genomosp. 9]|uniref:hypothetical protein n=1 Tax=Bordetella genomosp. 9 TaxID=1416803 RepID=UPI0012FAB6CE|nr:hypothetical protein [Bordetella genomosp. 9]